MAQSEISKPIYVILDGNNYFLWTQGMCSFLKGRKLWIYVTGQRLPPKQQKDKTEDALALQLEDQDDVNYQIITWLRNTSTPSVSIKFGSYDTAKDVWDMLASRYVESDGIVDHYKVLLVAKGFTQEYGIGYEETFAPVACLSSVRTLIVVFASRHWPLFQMDLKNAFLNGELTEEVYMQLPPSFSHPPGFSHKVCRLRRTLYGLK